MAFLTVVQRREAEPIGVTHVNEDSDGDGVNFNFNSRFVGQLDAVCRYSLKLKQAWLKGQTHCRSLYRSPTVA